MKKLIVGIVVLSFWVGASLCSAEQGIPNMVGSWSVKAEGGVITRKGAPNAKTHHSGEFSKLDAEVVVTKQQGRVFHGTFISPKASESFVAVIGMDNKSIFSADEDGFAEGRMVNKNKINFIYRHVTPGDTVVAAGIWTRKK
jgi:hypothetical protein